MEFIGFKFKDGQKMKIKANKPMKTRAENTNKEETKNLIFEKLGVIGILMVIATGLLLSAGVSAEGILVYTQDSTGSPVSGVNVSLFNESCSGPLLAQRESDINGDTFFSLENLTTPTIFCVSAKKTGHPEQQLDITLYPGKVKIIALMVIGANVQLFCDYDGDGYNTTFCPNGTDCDDNNSAIYPGVIVSCVASNGCSGTQTCVNGNWSECTTNLKKCLDGTCCVCEYEGQTRPCTAPNGCSGSQTCSNEQWSDCATNLKRCTDSTCKEVCPDECCVDENDYCDKPCDPEYSCVNHGCVEQQETCPFDCCIGETDYHDKSCDPDYNCVNHKCVPSTKDCPHECCSNLEEYKNKECPNDDYSCKNNDCIKIKNKENGESCSEKSECKTKNCFKGTCKRQEYVCDSDSDCSSNQYCENNECLKQTPDEPKECENNCPDKCDDVNTSLYAGMCQNGECKYKQRLCPEWHRCESGMCILKVESIIKYILDHILFIEIIAIILGLGVAIIHERLKKYEVILWLGIILLILGIIGLVLTASGTWP